MDRTPPSFRTGRPGASRTQAPLVLYVDCDEARCQKVKRALDGAGFKTVGATDLVDAVDHVRESSPSLVLLDMNIVELEEDASFGEFCAKLEDAPVPVLAVVDDVDRPSSDRSGRSSVGGARVLGLSAAIGRSSPERLVVEVMRALASVTKGKRGPIVSQ
jgi:CheY-like chemotaxis protein